MFVRRVYLFCDGKDCELNGAEASDADLNCSSVAEYKELMRRAGWIFKKGNKAYCPKCNQALQKGD